MKKTNAYLNRMMKVIQLPPYYSPPLYASLPLFIYPIFLTYHRYQLTLNPYQKPFDSDLGPLVFRKKPILVLPPHCFSLKELILNSQILIVE
jgi:hypothetical protein